MEARPMGEHSAFDQFRAQGGTLIWHHIFVCISVLNRTMKCTILMPPWVWNGRNYVDFLRSLRYQCSPIGRDGRGDLTTYPKLTSPRVVCRQAGVPAHSRPFFRTQRQRTSAQLCLILPTSAHLTSCHYPHHRHFRPYHQPLRYCYGVSAARWLWRTAILHERKRYQDKQR